MGFNKVVVDKFHQLRAEGYGNISEKMNKTKVVILRTSCDTIAVCNPEAEPLHKYCQIGFKISSSFLAVLLDIRYCLF